MKKLIIYEYYFFNKKLYHGSTYFEMKLISTILKKLELCITKNVSIDVPLDDLRYLCNTDKFSIEISNIIKYQVRKNKINLINN